MPSCAKPSNQGQGWPRLQNIFDRCSIVAENPQVQTTWGQGNDTPPFSADLREATPLPKSLLVPFYGVQSIKIKYFQECVFGKHFNRCHRLLPSCAALVSNEKIISVRIAEGTLDGWFTRIARRFVLSYWIIKNTQRLFHPDVGEPNNALALLIIR